MPSFSHPDGTHFCMSALDASGCIQASGQRNPAKRFLWLGASQLYGVNDRQEDDRAAPWIVFDAFRKQNIDVLSFAQPNGYPEEHLILFEHINKQIGLDGLIIGLVYDDMRESGIRPQIAAALAGPRKNSPELSSHAPVNRTAVHNGLETWQQISERWLTAALEECCAQETLRAEARGQIALGLADARRFMESLRARYTRDLSSYRIAIPAANYAKNRRALIDILDTARVHGIPVLMYIAPRPTDFFPYDRALQPEGLHHPRGVAASGFRPLRKIPHCCLP